MDKKKLMVWMAVVLIVLGIVMRAEMTRATPPSVSYTYPSDGAKFVPVWRGHGVNVTFNVTDSDGNLQRVVLQWNNSGTWETFYDSGSLGGVAYHNATVLNANWTGSWVTYDYRICAYDTDWANYTYTFTTEYVWGDPVMVYFDENMMKDYTFATVFKNGTGEYYLALDNATDHSILVVKTDSLSFVKKPFTVVDATAQSYIEAGVWSWFNYNSYPAFFYVDSGDNVNWKIAYYNGTSWNIADTGLCGKGRRCGIGIDIKYYNGKYYILCGRGVTNYYCWNLSFYYGNLPNLWTLITDLEGYCDSGYSNFFPNLNILNGYLILTYIHDADGVGSNPNGPMQWRVYDGSTLTNKGYVFSYNISGLSVEKDPVNNQLVAVYTNGTYLAYRVLTDPNGSWSNEKIIFNATSGYTILNPQLHYIDHRFILTFAYNIKGKYCIYMIATPEYLSQAEGVLKQYNRIQFPDATPNQQHVNSSVFYFENIDSRNIIWVNWSFSDIGQVQCENNIRLWGSVDNSTWTDLGTTDDWGYINVTAWTGGLPWKAGEKRYFKLEILNIGGVVEDFHKVEEGIILKVGLET